MKFLLRFLRRNGLDLRVYALIACVVLLAAALAGASWSAMGSSQERQAAAGSQVHTLEVLLQTDDLKVATLSMIRGERGYLITGDEAFLAPYTAGLAETRAGLNRLATLTRDNAEQQVRIGRLEGEMAHLRRVLSSLIVLQRQGRHDVAVERVRAGDGRIATDVILGKLREIEDIEHRLLALRTADAQTKAQSNERYQYLLTTTGILLLLLAVWATVLVRRALAAEAAAQRRLRQTAATDEMTGLSNRRDFMNALNRAVERSADGRKELSYAIFDIDHFKRVNDGYGHPAGDDVIREVARRAVGTFRARDLVGRLGGEEFGVLLPAANQTEALDACQRMRAAIEAEPIRVGRHALTVTVSVGVSQLRRGDDVESIVSRADNALYDAKNDGRNMVRLAA